MERETEYINVEEAEKINWVVDLNKELKKFNVSKEVQEEKWNKPSIYKLPASCLTNDNNHNKAAAYLPQTVSFGPYHHENEELRKMECHKNRALHFFLKRSNTTLPILVDTLMPMVQQLLDSYDSLDDYYNWHKDQDGFLKLMILDGCFMLEVLQWSDRAETAASSFSHQYPYAQNDPIFSNHGKLYFMPYIRRDMLMLENQLPMLLLKTLHAFDPIHYKYSSTKLQEIDEQEQHLNTIILKFCNTKNIDTNNNREQKPFGTCLHVLDLYRKSLLIIDGKINQSNHHKNHRQCQKCVSVGAPQKNKKMMSNDDDDENMIIWSAVNLHGAGVKFRNSDSFSLTNISFKGNKLKLPVVFIDDTTESTFMNLMAFERLHVGAGNEITSYVCFMDNIIDSAEDVKILKCNGLVHNAIGSDKAVAKLFNEMTKDVTPDPNSNLHQVERELHKYCKNRWNEWRANLIHTYFRSPWALLSLLAAVVLLAPGAELQPG